MSNQVEAAIETRRRYYAVPCLNTWCKASLSKGRLTSTTTELTDDQRRCPACGWLALVPECSLVEQEVSA